MCMHTCVHVLPALCTHYARESCVESTLCSSQRVSRGGAVTELSTDSLCGGGGSHAQKSAAVKLLLAGTRGKNLVGFLWLIQCKSYQIFVATTNVVLCHGFQH